MDNRRAVTGQAIPVRSVIAMKFPSSELDTTETTKEALINYILYTTNYW